MYLLCQAKIHIFCMVAIVLQMNTLYTVYIQRVIVIRKDSGGSVVKKNNPMTLRMDDELKEKIQQLAKKHRRSLTAEIEYLTEVGLKEIEEMEKTYEEFKKNKKKDKSQTRESNQRKHRVISMPAYTQYNNLNNTSIYKCKIIEFQRRQM